MRTLIEGADGGMETADASCIFAGVAQSVEQLTCNQQVGGSSPLASSMRV